MADTPDPFKQAVETTNTERSGGRPDEPCADPVSHCIDVQNAASNLTEPRVLPGDGTDVEFPAGWSEQQIQDWRNAHGVCADREPVARTAG